MSNEQTNTSNLIQSQLQVGTPMSNLLETNQNQIQYQIPDNLPSKVTQESSSKNIATWYNAEGIIVSENMNKHHGATTPYKQLKHQVKSGYIEKFAGPPPSFRRLSNQLVSVLPPLQENLKNINTFLFLDDKGTPTRQSVNTGDPQLDRIVHILRNDMTEMEARIKQEIKKTDVKIESLTSEFNSYKDIFTTELKDIKQQHLNSTNRFENRFKAQGTRHHYLPVTLLDGRSLTEAGLEELKSHQQIDTYDDNQIKEYLKFYNLSTVGSGQILKKRLLGYLGLIFVEVEIF